MKKKKGWKFWREWKMLKNSNRFIKIFSFNFIWTYLQILREHLDMIDERDQAQLVPALNLSFSLFNKVCFERNFSKRFENSLLAKFYWWTVEMLFLVLRLIYQTSTSYLKSYSCTGCYVREIWSGKVGILERRVYCEFLTTSLRKNKNIFRRLKRLFWMHFHAFIIRHCHNYSNDTPK